MMTLLKYNLIHFEVEIFNENFHVANLPVYFITWTHVFKKKQAYSLSSAAIYWNMS